MMALCAALMVVGQVALAVLPNIELVSFFVLIFTLKLRYKALLPIYVFVLIEGVIYGFGLWFLNYSYVWTVLWALVMFLPKVDSAVYYAVISAVFGLFFGALCSLPYFFIGGPSMALSYFVAGVRFDLLHAGGNLVITLALYRPIRKITEKAV